MLAFWMPHDLGHRDVRLMDGGHDKWLAEGRVMGTDVPAVIQSDYLQGDIAWTNRARLADVQAAIGSTATTILDVRLPGEYAGELFRPGAEPGEGQVTGHIPGAVHVPWEAAVTEDGAFRVAADLRVLYRAQGVDPEQEVIPYCTVGDRSDHTWFALTQILGYPAVWLYEASWAEWAVTTISTTSRSSGTRRLIGVTVLGCKICTSSCRS
jgi:thiosulfate/3-mercaptopyruvate sulfurtransferase